MAWTTPLTAVANATLTAAQWNATCRDNFLQMEPAKATGVVEASSASSVSGRRCRRFTTSTKQAAAACMFFSTGANAIAERSWEGYVFNKTGTGESTSSTSYTNLTTYGPSVTITTGTQALVFWGALLGNTTANAACYVSVGVSGASTVAASDSWTLIDDGHSAASGDDNMRRRSTFKLFTGLTAGENTFTMKYRVGSGTGQFNYRALTVWAM
jgi:hypothetical protein